MYSESVGRDTYKGMALIHTPICNNMASLDGMFLPDKKKRNQQ
jgi:hypothetical protein